MSTSMALGVITGIVFGLLVVFALLKLTKTDGKVKCSFDERQSKARGRGAEIGFTALLVYNGVYGLIGLFIEKQFLDTFTAMLIGVCISVAIYVVYCISNDAYFPLNASPKKLLLSFGIIAAVNFGIGFMNLLNGEVLVDGKVTFRSANLLCGLLFVILFIAVFVKSIKNKKQVD